MNKKSVFSIALSLVASAFMMVQAQPPKPPSVEERLKRVSTTVNKELALNAQQKEQLAIAYKNFFVAVDELHAKQSPPPPPPPANKAAVEKLAAARDEKIKAVLSAEQYNKYITLEKELRPKHKGVRPPKDDKMPPPVEANN